MTETLLEFLLQFVSEHKKQRMEEVLEWRTRHITVVLEDIHHPHNASAVLRSCEAFGIQDVYIIENRHRYELNPDVDVGASRWLDLIRYRDGDFNTPACLQTLREQGYRIVATTPKPPATPLAEYDISQPTALLFGAELVGLSEYAFQQADELISIPMVGFAESLNISVAAAVCLYELTGKLHRSDVDWRLSEAEKQELRLNWARQVLRKRVRQLEREFARRHQSR